MIRVLLRVVVASGAIWLAACSSYHSRWKAPVLTAQGRDVFEGSYQGRWESSRYRGASGKLWCILTKKSETEYLAEFRATWHGVFSSEHSVVLKAGSARGEEVRFRVDELLALPAQPSRKGRQEKAVAQRLVRPFSGAARIEMWIGSGAYRCEGTLKSGWSAQSPSKRNAWASWRWFSPPELKARYSADYDAGTFHLTRVEPVVSAVAR